MGVSRIAWFFFLVLIAGIAVFVFGCTVDEPVPEGRILIQFWHGMGGPLGEVLDRLIGEYNAGQHRYFIRGVNMGTYDTLQKKILASVVAGRSPDISQNFEALTLKLSRAGKLVCLDELIAQEPDPAAFRNDILPVMLENNTFDGKLWSFPFNKSVPVLYYNREMFRQAGLDPDRPPATVAELVEYARKMTRDTNGDGRPDIVGYSMTIRNEWNWSCLFRSFGGLMFDSETRAVALNSTAGYQATAVYVDMIRNGSAKFAEGYDHQNDWLAEKVGMFEASIVTRKYLEGKIKFDYGIAPIPQGDVRKAVILSGTNINIFNSGGPEKIAGAWDFIKWFTQTDIGARWSLESTYMPVRRSSLQSDRIQSALAADPRLSAPYIQLEYAEFSPRIPEWFECRVKISDELEQVYIKAAETRDSGREPDQDIVKHHIDRMQTSVTKVLATSLDTQF
ncbi:ABC transporter substrate-binding protein [bacterium]|nr:ABC transporter substrate-binding protein [candidate division CSSED10-310 bacterium]